MPAAFEEVVASAQVKNGRLFIEHRRVFDQQVALLDSRWALEISVRRRKATRSLRQNRYYWGCVVEAISQHTGYTPEEVHDFLKAKFIPKRLALADGNGEVKDEVVVGGSTRAMDTKAFSEFCETIKQWAATELDIYVPDADEVAL